MKTKLYILLILLVPFLFFTANGQNTVNLALKVYLEGPFASNEMTTYLNPSFIPLSQPYNVSPWNYNGRERVNSFPNADIVDWILVELRESPGDATTAYTDNIIAMQAAFLLRNGSVISFEGNPVLTFNVGSQQKLFVVVHHRNHLPMISGMELTLSGDTYFYDFTSGEMNALGGTLAQKMLAPGIWGMMSGDGNGDGQVSVLDNSGTWYTQAGLSGYLSADYDMNSQVGNPDRIEKWAVNTGKASQVPGFWFCNKLLADPRDGRMYKTRLIGNQCWMAENLNVGQMIDASQLQTDNSIIEKYCYDNDPANCNLYGGYYMWNEMMMYDPVTSSQGICPPNWHPASDIDWKIVEGFTDSQFEYPDSVWQQYNFRGYDCGHHLKALSGWYNQGNGSDLYSFKALPNGHGNPGNTFEMIHQEASFWTSSSNPDIGAFARLLSWIEPGSYRLFLEFDKALGVRCIRNETTTAPAPPYNPQPVNTGINAGLGTILRWMDSNPDGEPQTYDCFFGTTNPPPLVQSGVNDPEYFPGILDMETEYYWQVTVTDNHGHSNTSPVWSFKTGLQQSFRCGDMLYDNRDGQVYKTTLVGTQCWMSEDLNVGSMINGISNMSNDGIPEKYCYQNNPIFCERTGALYQWGEVMQYSSDPQGICPDGWQVPTDSDWILLEGNADTQYPPADPMWMQSGYRGYNAGLNLKAVKGWNQSGNGNNYLDFSGIPGGFRKVDGAFQHKGYSLKFWTASEENANTSAWSRSLFYNKDKTGRDAMTQNFGLALRCVKNNYNQAPAIPGCPQPCNNALNQAVNLTLGWNCSDPENDVLLFDVYLGTSAQPPVIASGINLTTFNPGVLSYGTTYYWKIVASDGHDNVMESPVWSFTTLGFTCGNSFVDPRDGNEYSTTQIGSQCWMAENLNAGIMIPGSQSASNNAVIEKYCYSNAASNCEVYGGLYSWDEMMEYINVPGSAGICPAGWHIPGYTEWTTLADFLEGPALAGGKMKETGTLHWNPPNTGATNSSGFTGLPGGNRGINSVFCAIGVQGAIWSSAEIPGGFALSENLYFNSAGIDPVTSNKMAGISVRCVKD